MNKMNYRCPASPHPNLLLSPLSLCEKCDELRSPGSSLGVKLHPSLGVSAILLNLHLNNLPE